MLSCEQRLLLTGTPVQNNLAELLTLLTFMLPKIFPLQVARLRAARLGPIGEPRQAVRFVGVHKEVARRSQVPTSGFVNSP